MKEWLEKLLAFITGNPGKTTEEYLKAIGEPPAQIDVNQLKLDKSVSPETAKMFDELVKNNNAMAEQIKSLTNTLSEEQKARKESIEATKAEQERQRVAKRDEWVKKNIEIGKIPPENDADKKYWSELYDLDAEKAETAISKIAGSTQSSKPSGGGKQEQTPGGAGKPTPQANLLNDAKAELAASMSKW